METNVVLRANQPVNAHRIPNNGDNQQKIANSAYKTVSAPMSWPMPIMGKPTVLQEVSVVKDTKPSNRQVVGNKMAGVNTLKPTFTMVGVVLAAIKMENNKSTHIIANTAGKPTAMMAQCGFFKDKNKPVMPMMAVMIAKGAISNQSG